MIRNTFRSTVRTFAIFATSLVLLLVPVSLNGGHVVSNEACGSGDDGGNCTRATNTICLYEGVIIQNYRTSE